MSARIAPAPAPYDPEIRQWLERVMPPDTPPLRLFTTLARDQRLFGRFFAGGLLDRGHLSLRQRELVINRTTARCGCEYEWGIHVSAFGARAGFTPAQCAALVHDTPEADCWSEQDRLLLRFCDALHARADIDDVLWTQLRGHYSEEAMLELLLLAGFYRTVSYLGNALRLPLEPDAARFPLHRQSSDGPGPDAP